MEILRLFYSFAKVGLFGFGGGPSMIPLIQEEVVEVQGWLTREEFLDAYAFGNALPGPIATKLAGYVGYKVAGPGGALSGLLGMTVPTIVAMLILGGLYFRYRDTEALAGFLRGVRPVVVALLLMVVWQFVPSAFGPPAQWLGSWALWLVATVAFVLAVFYNVHPAALIVAGGLLGIFVLRA
jgi:chromate transporter